MRARFGMSAHVTKWSIYAICANAAILGLMGMLEKCWRFDMPAINNLPSSCVANISRSLFLAVSGHLLVGCLPARAVQDQQLAAEPRQSRRSPNMDTLGTSDGYTHRDDVSSAQVSLQTIEIQNNPFTLQLTVHNKTILVDGISN